jgi:hypothetical protein
VLILFSSRGQICVRDALYVVIKPCRNLTGQNDELVEHDEEEKVGSLGDWDEKEVKETVDKAQHQYSYIHHTIINSNGKAEDAHAKSKKES